MRYGHTNLIARDWRHLADFYTAVFGCVPVLPERDLHADWLARATRIPGARLRVRVFRQVAHSIPGVAMCSSPSRQPEAHDATEQLPTRGERRCNRLGCGGWAQ